MTNAIFCNLVPGLPSPCDLAWDPRTHGCQALSISPLLMPWNCDINNNQKCRVKHSEVQKCSNQNCKGGSKTHRVRGNKRFREMRNAHRYKESFKRAHPSPRHWACALGYGLGLYECRQHHLQGPGRALGWETGLGDHSKSHPSSIFQNSLVCRYVQSFLKHSRSLLFCKHLK